MRVFGLGSGRIHRVDSAYYEEIAGRLRGLLIRLSDRLSAQDLRAVTEYTDANELGIALEVMADVLSAYELSIAPDEPSDMLALHTECRWVARSPRRSAAVHIESRRTLAHRQIPHGLDGEGTASPASRTPS